MRILEQRIANYRINVLFVYSDRIVTFVRECVKLKPTRVQNGEYFNEPEIEAVEMDVIHSINLSLEPKRKSQNVDLSQIKFTDAGRNIIENTTSSGSTSTMSFTTILLVGAALIVVTIFVGMLISWFIKMRKFRELRHRLIPMYTFDPNDEGVWETDFMNSEHSTISLTSVDYHSVDNVK